MDSRGRYCFRDPGASAPALAFAQSYWALQQREIDTYRSMERACRAGDAYLEAGLSAERMPDIRKLLKEFPVQLIAQGWAATAVAATPFLERAVELGACCINFHLGHAYMRTEEAVGLIEQVRDLASAHGLSLLVETHRGRMTQDLLRMVDILTHTSDLALVLDVSHYLVAGEGVGGHNGHFQALMTTIADHTAMLHGRLSDGQSIQVGAGDPLALTADTAWVWSQVMRSWLADAPSNAVFVFEPELGPPPYAQRGVFGSETSSRTQESALLRQLACKEWAAALAHTEQLQGSAA